LFHKKEENEAKKIDLINHIKSMKLKILEEEQVLAQMEIKVRTVEKRKIEDWKPDFSFQNLVLH
jgi:hypothetical protein